MSDWELEHLPIADDVTIVELFLEFQFEGILLVWKKVLTLMDLKSQVASIIYNQVRPITLKIPSLYIFDKFTYYFVAIKIISYTVIPNLQIL